MNPILYTPETELCSIGGGVDTYTLKSKQSTGIDENVLEIDGNGSSYRIWNDAEEAVKFSRYCSEETPSDVHAPDCVQNYRQETDSSEQHADIGDLRIDQRLWRAPSEEESRIVILTISLALTIVSCATHRPYCSVYILSGPLHSSLDLYILYFTVTHCDL
jgi:hypothetical protein